MKPKRSASAARPKQRDGLIESKTPIEIAQPAAAGTLPGPSLADLTMASTPRSWLSAERALYTWSAIVVACVVWQPLLLGFYLDDWSVSGSTQGKPFSLARFLFADSTDPTRPGLVPLRFLFSSLFGDHPLLWQGALLLANCGAALSIVAVSRVLTQPRTPMGRMITAAVGLCWLLLPWNAAARFWLTTLPYITLIAVEGWFCTFLIRGWAKNQSHAIAAGALYLWMCLSYEAFYLQWIPLVLIGVALWMAKRTALPPVVRSGIALITAQGAAGLWNLYTKSKGFEAVKYVLPNWRQAVRQNVLNLAPAALQSVFEISAEFAFFGVVVFAVWLIVYVRSLSRASDRPAGSASALLAGASLLGGLVSVVVFSLGGRIVTATGVETRSMIVFNFWIVIAAAILTTFTVERLDRVPRLIFAFALAGLGLCLAAGQVLRAGDWATAWTLEERILAQAPIAELNRTEQDAQIVFLNPLDVNGAPIFAASWDINQAILLTYPVLRSRTFVIYSHWAGRMKWDGKQLSYENQPAFVTTDHVYLWRPSDGSFWRPTGPFVVNPDLTVRQLP